MGERKFCLFFLVSFMMALGHFVPLQFVFVYYDGAFIFKIYCKIVYFKYFCIFGSRFYQPILKAYNHIPGIISFGQRGVLFSILRFCTS